MFQPSMGDENICTLCKSKADQEALDVERKHIHDTVTNKENLLIQALTTKHHWKLDLLMASKGKLIKAYALLKRPLNFQQKAPTEGDAVALSLLQSRQDHMTLLSLVAQNSNSSVVDAQNLIDEQNQKSIDALQTKNASHIKWKNFLTVNQFGPTNNAIFGLMDFLNQKVQHENPLTGALAKERLYIVDMVCKQAQTRKKSHTSELPRKTNYIILQTFKRLARDLKNLAPIDDKDTVVFETFYDSIIHTAAEENNFRAIMDPNLLAGTLSHVDKHKLQNLIPFQKYTAYYPNSQKQNIGDYQYNNHQGGGGPAKNTKSDHRSEPYEKQNNRKNPVPDTSNVPFASIASLQKKFEPVLNGTAAEKASILKSSQDENKQTDAAFWKTFCKNCFWSNKLTQHSLKECRAMGNPCKINCPECYRSGDKRAYHWLESCPKKIR